MVTSTSSCFVVRIDERSATCGAEPHRKRLGRIQLLCVTCPNIIPSLLSVTEDLSQPQSAIPTKATTSINRTRSDILAIFPMALAGLFEAKTLTKGQHSSRAAANRPFTESECNKLPTGARPLETNMIFHWCKGTIMETQKLQSKHIGSKPRSPPVNIPIQPLKPV